MESEYRFLEDHPPDRLVDGNDFLWHAEWGFLLVDSLKLEDLFMFDNGGKDRDLDL
jgi:hypothetical protein